MVQDDIFLSLVNKIITEQESIIGPVAFEQAYKVPGLKVDMKTHGVTIDGDKKQVLEALVKQYEGLFGRTSVEVCRDAVKNYISSAPKDQVPQVLL